LLNSPVARIVCHGAHDFEVFYGESGSVRGEAIVSTIPLGVLAPLLTDLNAFIAKTQERVTGEIKIKMHNGSYRVVGRKSTFSLYDNDTITYTSNSNFDQRLATGFVTFWGLQSSAANAKICKNKA
jgi:argininosuccinate synthase